MIIAGLAGATACTKHAYAILPSICLLNVKRLCDFAIDIQTQGASTLATNLFQISRMLLSNRHALGKLGDCAPMQPDPRWARLQTAPSGRKCQPLLNADCMRFQPILSRGVQGLRDFASSTESRLPNRIVTSANPMKEFALGGTARLRRIAVSDSATFSKSLHACDAVLHGCPRRGTRRGGRRWADTGVVYSVDRAHAPDQGASCVNRPSDSWGYQVRRRRVHVGRWSREASAASRGLAGAAASLLHRLQPRDCWRRAARAAREPLLPALRLLCRRPVSVCQSWWHTSLRNVAAVVAVREFASNRSCESSGWSRCKAAGDRYLRRAQHRRGPTRHDVVPARIEAQRAATQTSLPAPRRSDGGPAATLCSSGSGFDFSRPVTGHDLIRPRHLIGADHGSRDLYWIICRRRRPA
jgi:hypothetical protein